MLSTSVTGHVLRENQQKRGRDVVEPHGEILRTHVIWLNFLRMHLFDLSTILGHADCHKRETANGIVDIRLLTIWLWHITDSRLLEIPNLDSAAVIQRSEGLRPELW